jgi:hypothetical protein
MESDLKVRANFLRGVAVLALGSLAACSIFKNNEEAQAIVNQGVIGMPVGDFFQAYGPPRTRSEQLDGSTSYDWQSSIDKVAAGPVGLDERTCTLRLVGDRRGRIATADIVLDNPGRLSTSRCGEMFKAK